MEFTTINTLNNDVLFSVFNYYRLDNDNAWNVRLGWRKISHVCQRWRYLVYSIAFHLRMHILCTNGTPTIGSLDHLPPLPLFIDYRDTTTTATISKQDELAINHALLLRDRIRHIDLRLPPSILHKSLMIMDEAFPILEHLSLSSTTKEDTNSVLPKTFLAPNLRHLTCSASIFQKDWMLSSTVSLVTLDLKIIHASGYLLPGLFVARLRSLSQLEDLSIEFSIPLPRPSAASELLGEQGNAVTLPNLKHFRFRGVSAYLECFVAQIRAPLLERLDITLFNQVAFALPHLSRLIDTRAFKLPTARVCFGRKVFISLHHETTRRHRPFIIRVMCKELDWQIDCAAQVCSTLMSLLSGIQQVNLEYDEPPMPIKWENDEIDGTTWHELLRSFIGAKSLRVCNALSKELSRALQVDEVGLDPGLLPCLQEIELYEKRADTGNLFSSFVNARRVADRPVRLLPELSQAPSAKKPGEYFIFII